MFILLDKWMLQRLLYSEIYSLFRVDFNSKLFDIHFFTNFIKQNCIFSQHAFFLFVYRAK